MKKLVSILFSILTCLCIGSVPIHAENTDYVKDEYGLLDESSQTALEDKIQSLVNTYSVGIYIRLLPDIGSYDIEEYAELLYQQEDLGIGQDKNGLLLIMEFNNRTYDLCAYGNKAHAAFTDYRKQTIEEAMLEYFSNDEWKEGFEAVISESKVALANYSYQQSPDKYNKVEEYNSTDEDQSTMHMYFFAPLLALIITLFLASKHKTKGIATRAGAYITEGGIHLSTALDLYSHTTRTVRHIPRQNNTNGGGGGHSSNHGGGFSHSSGHF